MIEVSTILPLLVLIFEAATWWETDGHHLGVGHRLGEERAVELDQSDVVVASI